MEKAMNLPVGWKRGRGRCPTFITPVGKLLRGCSNAILELSETRQSDHYIQLLRYLSNDFIKSCISAFSQYLLYFPCIGLIVGVTKVQLEQGWMVLPAPGGGLGCPHWGLLQILLPYESLRFCYNLKF